MKCPYCAEEIKDEAIVCRYCQRDLVAIRLNVLEKTVKERLTEVDRRLADVDRKFDQLEERTVSNRLEKKPLPRKERWGWGYPLAFMIGSVAPIFSVYYYSISHLVIFLSFPFLAWIGAGMTAALLSYKRKVAYYALLGFGIGVMSFAGIVAATRIAVAGMVNSETILSASQYSVRAWGLMPLLFFMAPLFSVILGSFIGEWLESSQPSGRKMEYSRSLAKQITGMSSRNAPSEMDIDKLSKLIAAIAPLIAAIGGIVVPIVTALSR